MKIRLGFVSNSSSSSFIISKKDVSEDTLWKIKNYLDSYSNEDGWSYTEFDNELRGYTIMDNGYFNMFLKTTDMPFGAIEFDD